MEIKLKHSVDPLSHTLTDLISKIEEGDTNNYYIECNFE